MKTRISSVLIAGLILLTQALKADEGMWIPMLLKKYNISEMKKKGFKLDAEDIYSVNQSSMKDAVMIFGGGCTGELISDQGLLITNHHCGYSYIQKHSTLEHDYLTDGFWAMSKKEELKNSGLEVKFLEKMEDVTDRVMEGISNEMTESQREKKIKENIATIKEETEVEEYNEINIKPFFQGNQYFMFINKIYKDVRLVGAPPSSIGKFGGDTDNWMWPRHTGDFSLFRIYTAPDGTPAKYSKDNIPMKPEKHFPVSLRGYEKGDFTMVFGYPGSTDEYAPSYELELKMNTVNPFRIGMRGKLIKEMKKNMEKDKLVRIQYSTKAARLSNGWKKWKGESRGLKNMKAIKIKKDFENEFNEWAKNTQYNNILDKYEVTYDSIKKYEKGRTAVIEMIYGLELMDMAAKARSLVNSLNAEASSEKLNNEVEKLNKKAKNFYEDYHKPTAKAVTKEALDYYMNNVRKKWWPELLFDIRKKGLNDIVDDVFENSIFASEKQLTENLDDSGLKAKTFENDPVFALYKDLLGVYLTDISPKRNKFSATLDSLDRHYMSAQMEFMDRKVFYPDANFTLRISYGNVDRYKPKDAVRYKYYTTVEGIMEKDNPEIYDYDVPEKLKELYLSKEYGKYSANDGEMHVCFIASNHTSGGNSGSPVINADGHLIGVNFDRNWEGTMSDLMYNPDMCRNITLDIRYALFIIDKFAGATHLVDEMTIIQ